MINRYDIATVLIALGFVVFMYLWVLPKISP